MFRSIRVKYTLLVLIPIVAITLVSLVRDLLNLHHDVRDLKQREVESQAVFEASRLDSFFESTERIVGVMASGLARESRESPERIYSLLESTLEGNPALYGAKVAFAPEAGGKLSCPAVFRQGDRLVRANLADKLDYTEERWEWYRVVSRDRRPHWSEPATEPGGKGVFVTSYSAPFYRGDSFAGVVTVDIALSTLKSLAELRSGGRSLVIVTSRGEFVVGGPGNSNLLEQARRSRQDDQLSYALKLTRHEGPGSTLVQTPDGPAVAIYVPLQRTGWSLGWQVSEASLLANETRQLGRRAATDLFTLLGAALVLWLVMGWITSPVLKLRDQMDQFAKGQPLKELPPNREDELGDLFCSFHTMSEVLLDREEHIQDLETQRFNVLVANLPGAVYRCQADDQRRVEFVSERIEELCGYPASEFLEGPRRRLDSLIVPTDLEQARAAVDEAVRADRPWKVQYRFQHRDGRTLWVEDTGQAIDRPDGAPEWLDGILLDITEQKLAREVVEESERRLQAIIDNAADSIYLKDPAGRYLMVNRTFATRVGRSLDQVVGQTDDELFPPELAAQRREHERQVIASRQPVQYEEQQPTREGGTRTYLVSQVPLLDARGEPYAVSSFATDITERKTMEDKLLSARLEADAANLAKSEFLARISHEIRTPMNAVIGLCHLALQTELSANQRDYLSKIQGSAQSLLGIMSELGTINDVLDFSKLEAGERTLEQVDFNLNTVLDDVLGLFSVKAAEKGLEMFFLREADVPEHLVGSPLRLAQVLTNLVSNAVKFTQNGDIVVRSSLLSREHDSAVLRFTVQDTGQGMTQKQLEQLFQPFTQARAKGGGLGLIICKRLVEMMGGSLEVASRPGQGSTFSFTIRCRLQERRPGSGPSVQLDLKGTRVLVVDDRPTARKILAEMLASMSFEVATAGSGGEALAMLEQGPFEVVLMDWRMSGMSGLETSREIHKRFSGSRRPYILMVTNYGRDEMRDGKAGLDDLDGFVLKPVTPTLLFEAIARVVGGESRAASSSPDDARLPTAHILLAEDDEINQQVAGEMLQHLGMRVSIAANGQEVLDRLSGESFDLVLMDLQMPVLDGWEATRRIRSDRALARLPIIAMTAHAMVGDRERCLEAGMNDHLAKPIDPKTLRSTLSRWLTAFTGELPPLPGIDTPGGLRRLGGNVKLYRKLLGDFRERFSQAADRLRAGLSQKDSESIAQQAHTLAGVSANLGITGVERAARELEKAARAGPVEQSLVETVEASLSIVLPALEGLQAPVASPPSGPVGDPAEKVRALLALLRQGDPGAGPCLEEVRTFLTGADEVRLTLLERQVDNLDFDEAARTLEDIVRKLNLGVEVGS